MALARGGSNRKAPSVAAAATVRGDSSGLYAGWPARVVWTMQARGEPLGRFKGHVILSDSGFEERAGPYPPTPKKGGKIPR